MNSKNWLKKWIIVFIILIISSFIFIFCIHNHNNVPLRFTNSISYDAKINFLKKSEKFQSAEILIIGSSMGLNNINSKILSQDINNDNILNLSSWGLKVNEIYEFLKILDLSKIKKIIYLNQYFDFYGESINSFDKKDINDFLYNNYYINAYFNTFHTLTSNFKDYIKWEKRYLDNNKYSSLLYNEFGDVLLNIDQNNASKNRWNAITDIHGKKNQYDSFVNMIHYLNEKNIDINIVTTPYRQKFFSENKFNKHYNKYTSKINNLSKKYNYRYINLQNVLNLEDKYFADSSHLNFKGSSLVSKELVKSIK